MKGIKVRWCKLADMDHQETRREYCHTYHKKNTICCCNDFYFLPDKHFWAILLHEVGHLLAGRHGNESDADRAAFDEFGVIVFYRDSKEYGNELECIPKDKIPIIEGRLRKILSFAT